jgi:hypothetical protein
MDDAHDAWPTLSHFALRGARHVARTLADA